jgi:hypothetical protein
MDVRLECFHFHLPSAYHFQGQEIVHEYGIHPAWNIFVAGSLHLFLNKSEINSSIVVVAVVSME